VRRSGAQRAQQIVGRVRWLAEQGVRLITGTDAGMVSFDNFPAALQGLALWDFTAINLYSDTQTRPVEAMRAAMAAA